VDAPHLTCGCYDACPCVELHATELQTEVIQVGQVGGEWYPLLLLLLLLLLVVVLVLLLGLLY
jgi:hypothetical protein